jgi:hypothetical protein
VSKREREHDGAEIFLLLARSDWLISIAYACPLGIDSPTLSSMLRFSKVAGYFFFNKFLCNILLSKTKMGVTSYPEELATYKWHQKTPHRSFLLTCFTRNFGKQQTATLETLSLGHKCRTLRRKRGNDKKYNKNVMKL